MDLLWWMCLICYDLSGGGWKTMINTQSGSHVMSMVVLGSGWQLTWVSL